VGLGLPVGWERVAQRVTEHYGHGLVLAAAPDAFNENGGMIDLYVDGKRAGGLEFIWDDQWPRSQVLAELWNRVTDVLAQDLGSGV